MKQSIGRRFEPYLARNLYKDIIFGEMVEWTITTVLKTVGPKGSGGSNPSLTATSTTEIFLVR